LEWGRNGKGERVGKGFCKISKDKMTALFFTFFPLNMEE
jgi:hypothetical protein